MAPGAVTAATIAHGSKNPNAGAAISVGHGIIEFPLIIFIMLGLGKVLASNPAQITIGIIGGIFMIFIAATMLNEIRNPHTQTANNSKGPLLTGILLTASNPYFLIWWASVGLNLTISARKIGIVAFILFAITHWLCDLVWLWILSWASYKGTALLGPRNQKYILAACALVLILFSMKFIYDAIILWT